jgi:hypothetical protein
MNVKRAQRRLTTLVISLGLFALFSAAVAAPKKGKGNHHDGKQLIGEKIKTKGHHAIDKKGDYAVSAEVKDGKIAGVHVKHAKKGDVPVKKYKSKQKMALLDIPQTPAVPADDYVGTVWIGYAYYDDYGNEEIYWFPYDMIYDGDTGAIEYVPASAGSPPE